MPPPPRLWQLVPAWRPAGIPGPFAAAPVAPLGPPSAQKPSPPAPPRPPSARQSLACGFGATAHGATALGATAELHFCSCSPRTYGGAGIVAGVAAQYLQLHPQAAATEVREALLGGASAGTITGVGVNPPAALLFTNYSSAPAGAAGESGSSSGGGGGLNAGAIVGIVVGAAAGEPLGWLGGIGGALGWATCG